MLQQKPHTLFIYITFLVIAVIAYWQIAFLQNSLKWDMIDCYLPWRFHVGECLQNGVFPYWNPYTHGGYPIHADLRSVWYPEAFIIGLTTGYSNLTLHLLFIIYLSLAGLGMYLLAGHFTDDWRAAAIAGIAYLLSGFFTGHGQEMFGIIAAAWIPFVLYYYIRVLLYRQIPDVLCTSLFAFLLITGGYQAMWAIMLYLMLTLLIVYFIKYWRSGEKKEAWHLVKLNGLLALLTGLSLTVIAVTYFQVSPHLSRLGGVSLQDAWFMPFSPRSALSFLIPFATVKDSAWYDTDFSMNNAYAGLIVLIFSVLSLFSKRRLLLNVFLVFGLVTLLASFGKYTPVRAVLYHIFPLLNLFRHSSFFSYFALVTIIVAASAGLGDYLANPEAHRKKLFRIIFLAVAIIAGLLVWAIFKIVPDSIAFTKPITDFASWLAAPSRYEHIAIHSILQLIFLAVFIFIVKSVSSGKYSLLVALVIIEMTVAVQLNIYYTVASPGVDPVEMSDNINRRAPGFPVPQPGVSLSVNTEQNAAYSVLWRNTNILDKTVSLEGFNSFRLKGCESLADSFPQLAQKVMQNQLVYLSDTILQFNEREASGFTGDQTVLFADRHVFRDGFSELKRSPDDSLSITCFYPGNTEAIVSSKYPVAVTLLQGWYPGWKVFVDGKESKFFISNKMFISTLCTTGRHTVKFSYSNRLVLIGFAVSYLVVLITLSWLIFISFKKKKRTVKLLLIALLWIVTASPALARFNPFSSYQHEKEMLYKEASMEIVKSESTGAVCNVDDMKLMRRMLTEAGFKGKSYFQNLTYRQGLSSLIFCLDSLTQKSIARVNLYAPVPPEADAAFSLKWAVNSTTQRFKNGNLEIRRTGTPAAGFESRNDFEHNIEGWTGDISALDSLHHLNGKFSNRVDSLHQGSFAYKWLPEKGMPGKGTAFKSPFRIFVKAAITGNFKGASLIIQQRRNSKIIKSFSAGSDTYQVSDDKWTMVAKAGIFPDELEAGDELNVFFWGNGKSVFYIDDFSVDVRFGKY